MKPLAGRLFLGPPAESMAPLRGDHEGISRNLTGIVQRMSDAKAELSCSRTAVKRERDEVQYEVLRKLPEVEAIAEEWNGLLWKSPCNRAFSSPIWYIAACRTQSQFFPHVLIARSQGRLAGVLPLGIRPDDGKAVFPGVMSNYNDVVAEATDVAIVAGLLQHATTPGKPYSCLTLSWVPEISNCMRALPLLRLHGNNWEHVQPAIPYYFLNLPPTYEDFLATRSRAFRKGIYRARRQAEKDGLELRQLDPACFPPDRLPELFLSLHVTRFGQTSSFHKDPRNADFARIALPVLFARRQMVVFALFYQSEIVGIDLSMVGQESLCTWNGGYSPEVERWSPGRLLIDAGIRRAFELGLKEYDFLRGGQAWKESWCNQVRSVGHIEVPVSN